MAAHARLSASKMKQAKACRGSVLAQAGYANRESKAAKEGTAAHWVAEMCLLSGEAVSAYLGRTAPNGIKITQPMVMAVQVYIDEVLARAQGAQYLGVEVKFDHLAQLHPDLGGTSDAVIYHAANRTLYVMDYKNGAGVLVDPEENEQALTYGMGALMHPDIKGRPIDTVEIVIVQPNAIGEPVKIWRTDPIRLVEWAAEAIDIAAEARDPKAPRAAGPQCQFCLARGDCQTHYEFALDAAGITPVDFYSDVIPKVEAAARLSADELAKRMAQAEHLKRWIRSIEEYALQRALDGDPPKGFKLVGGRSTRTFASPETAIAQIAAHFGVPEDELFNTSPMSPAQIENAIGKKEIEAFAEWETLIAKKPGNPTLAPVSDKRPALSKIEDFDVLALSDLE